MKSCLKEYADWYIELERKYGGVFCIDTRTGIERSAFNMMLHEVAVKRYGDADIGLNVLEIWAEIYRLNDDDALADDIIEEMNAWLAGDIPKWVEFVPNTEK